MARYAAVSLAVVLFCGLAAAPAGVGDAIAAGGHRLLMQTTLDGESGDVLTCYDSDGARACIVTFPKADAKLKITVVMADDKGVEQLSTIENGSGRASLPMLDGHLKRLTIEFRDAGACSVHVHVRE